MKTSRYSDSQILSILKQAAGGVPVSALCREHGMSSERYLLQVAGQIRRHGCLAHGAYEGAGKGKRRALRQIWSAAENLSDSSALLGMLLIIAL